MNGQEIAVRIERRSAAELSSVLRELESVLPDSIKLVERIEERPVLGKCLFEVVAIDDPLLGYREFILHAYQFTGTVKNKLAKEKLHRFQELVDHEGQPIMPPQAAKDAVLDCLRSSLDDDADYSPPMAKSELAKRLNITADTLGKWLKETPPRIRVKDVKYRTVRVHRSILEASNK